MVDWGGGGTPFCIGFFRNLLKVTMFWMVLCNNPKNVHVLGMEWGCTLPKKCVGLSFGIFWIRPWLLMANDLFTQLTLCTFLALKIYLHIKRNLLSYHCMEDQRHLLQMKTMEKITCWHPYCKNREMSYRNKEWQKSIIAWFLFFTLSHVVSKKHWILLRQTFCQFFMYLIENYLI